MELKDSRKTIFFDIGMRNLLILFRHDIILLEWEVRNEEK